ncbi:MAG: hypothetical protein H0T68_09830 [Gemmatimonadales bacterium]|nr:hypothetical protein [Gemmatimonadales bacterium]
MIQLRIPSVLSLALVSLALAGCGERPPEPPKMSEAFPNLPLPPQATFVSRAGGSGALQLTVMSPRPRKEVESYYREVLSRGGWRLVNEAKGADGALVLLAEQDGPPLWVSIRATNDGAATIVDLAGAILERRDTATAAAKPTS